MAEGLWDLSARLNRKTRHPQIPAQQFGIRWLVELPDEHASDAGGMACCWVLLPRQRFVLALQEALSSTSGIAEMAASARMSEPVSIRVSNLVTSAIHDLVRALALTLIAVIFFVSIGSSSTPVAPQIHIGHQPGLRP
jgi:hypothetical protein